MIYGFDENHLKRDISTSLDKIPDLEKKIANVATNTDSKITAVSNRVAPLEAFKLAKQYNGQLYFHNYYSDPFTIGSGGQWVGFPTGINNPRNIRHDGTYLVIMHAIFEGQPADLAKGVVGLGCVINNGSQTSPNPEYRSTNLRVGLGLDTVDLSFIVTADTANNKQLMPRFYQTNPASASRQVRCVITIIKLSDSLSTVPT